MLTDVRISRATGDGRYADVLDVAEHLAGSIYGTAANAIVVMVRSSEMYTTTARKIGVKPKSPNE